MNGMVQMGRVKHIHFVGIGGAGMAGIAEVLLRQGYRISGSDLVNNASVNWLQMLGATVYQGHRASYIRHADVIVHSSAIPAHNVELQAAQQAYLPIVSRGEMLGELMRFREGIVFAGSHGKTTITSLAVSLCVAGGLDPTFVIGGCLKSMGSHARLGQGRYLIAEADESDRSFLYLNPVISLITNIDQDHMGTYAHDFQELKKTFVEFLHRLPFYGLAVLCLDDPVIKEDILPRLSRSLLTYGFDAKADFRTQAYTHGQNQTQFTVYRPAGLSPLEVTLNLVGRHNVLNALGAIAIASQLQIADQAILTALKQFGGVGRRFQIYGEFSLEGGRVVTLVDDYGHHPREILVTLAAVRESWPIRRIVMVYQPHRYTRTRDLFDDFCDVLSTVDQLLLLPVYPAGEGVIDGADSLTLAQAIEQRYQRQAMLAEADEQLLLARLQPILCDGDILLMQGAGNIGALAAQLAKLLTV